MSMNIGFTGHRDKLANPSDLQRIADEFEGGTWIHGGAEGFDTQVDEFALKAGLSRLIIRPDYATYGRSAPLIRNREIVDSCNLLIALYDGRGNGGTKYTIDYARKKGTKTIILVPFIPVE